MNPEFERNLWLEASPRRIAWAAVALGVIYGLTALGGGRAPELMHSALATAGLGVAVACGMIWGARAAGGSVLDEVGDRTWDFQRLSALKPWAMTWGKLFGATSLTWICTLSGLVVAGVALASASSADALTTPLYFGLAALLIQGVSMSAALVGVRKARAEGRTARSAGVAGGVVIGAALLVGVAVSDGFRQGAGFGDLSSLFTSKGEIEWWTFDVPAQVFRLAAIAAFAAWALAGAWRLMRLELQMQNAPATWIAFLVFLTVFVAGHGYAQGGLPGMEVIGLAPACIGGAVACALCAYVSAFAEPADRVRLRQFFAAFGERRFGRAYALLPATTFPIAFAVALVVMAFVCAAATGQTDMFSPPLGRVEIGSQLWQVAGLIAFVIRDLGVIAFHRFGPRPQRGDFGAVLTLALLYLAGGILGEIAGPDGRALFAPLQGPAGLSLAGGAVQAVSAWWLAVRRIRAPEASAGA